MRRLIFLICITIASLAGWHTRAAEPLFEIPQAPDHLQSLQQRSNYIVYHFWDKANLGTAFSSRAKLNDALGVWLGLMPYSSADTTHLAINSMLDKLKKKPENLLVLAQMAEGWLWADTAQLRSDEVYLPFAKAVASQKKLSQAERARFAAQTKIIESSSPGLKLPPLKLVGPTGEKSLLSDTTGRMSVIMFMDPECTDCRMAKVRLANDYTAKQLIAGGQLDVISVYPGSPSDPTWTQWAAEAPEGWRVVAAPEADEYFDLRVSPAIYLAAGNGTILIKNMNINALIQAMPALKQ